MKTQNAASLHMLGSLSRARSSHVHVSDLSVPEKELVDSGMVQLQKTIRPHATLTAAERSVLKLTFLRINNINR